MYLFFDTETTGLPGNWQAPVTDVNNWPRLVQLAYLLYDNNGNKISSGDYIIKPEGFTIPIDSSRIHGISTEKARKEGKELFLVLQNFQVLVNQADFLVAHNMSFDEKIIGAEFIRNRMIDYLAPKKKICTMESTTTFCAIDGPYGYKWPKLSELHYKLFRSDFNEAHNAAVDINATAKCFWELMRLGIINNNCNSIANTNFLETSELKKLMYGCFRSFRAHNLLNEDSLINDLPSVVTVLVESSIIKKEQFKEAMYYFLHCFNFGCNPKMTDDYIRTTLINGILLQNSGVDRMKGAEILDFAFEIKYDDLDAKFVLPKIYDLNF